MRVSETKLRGVGRDFAVDVRGQPIASQARRTGQGEYVVLGRRRECAEKGEGRSMEREEAVVGSGNT